jgi:hypothetical protein
MPAETGLSPVPPTLSRRALGQERFRARGFRALRAVFLGTLAPRRRASDRPIAIACFPLVTLFAERPERSVPRLRSRIALPTFLLAVGPYLRAFFATMETSFLGVGLGTREQGRCQLKRPPGSTDRGSTPSEA